MQYMNGARSSALVAVAAIIGALACGSDTGVPTRTDVTNGQSPSGRTGGTDTSGTPATSNGPVASVTVSPKQVTLRIGYYGHVIATPRDANGLYVVGKKAVWTSSSGAVVIASDTGVIYGKAVGSATVYGTIDGHRDSASVTVVAASPDTSVTPAPTPVSVFNLGVTVVGPVAGSDTSTTQPVAGATVKVTRVMSIRGDTLNPSVVAGTITTDANGAAALPNLPGGFYTFLATPPAGSAFVTSSAAIAPPTISDVRVRIVLRRDP